MRRDAQAVLLVLVGGSLVRIGATGTYVRFVRAGLLAPLMVVSGVVLIAIACVTLQQGLRAPRDGSPSAIHARGGGDPAPDPGPGSAEPWAGWLLLVPALALVLLAPPALGSFQAGRQGTALSAQVSAAQASSGFAPLPNGDPVHITMLDYALRAAADGGRSLAGRRVVLSGFVVAGPDGQPYLTRMVIGCCAAGARPVKVGLAGDVPPDLAPDVWIEVEGSYTDRFDRDPVNQGVIPYLQVAVSRDMVPPEQQYES